MDEKKIWEEATPGKKREVVIFGLLSDDFENEEIEDADLDNAVYDLDNLEDREAVNKIKALPGFKAWILENEERVANLIAVWEKIMENVFG